MFNLEWYEEHKQVPHEQYIRWKTEELLAGECTNYWMWVSQCTQTINKSGAELKCCPPLNSKAAKRNKCEYVILFY